MPMAQTRRRFLTLLAAAGGSGFAHAPCAWTAEEAPETTSVRIDRDRSTCAAPQDVAEELLRTEGFTDIRYVELEPYRTDAPSGHNPIVAAMERGEVDFGMNFPVLFIPGIETGAPITVLAGVHSGCFELFAREGIRSIAELKGKTVGLNASPPGLLILMAAQVGLDPARDIRWISGADPAVRPLELFAEGKIDAFLGFPPEPQELRARRAGHVIVSTTVDRPWSQYFCCMLTAHREFVRKYPVATKRALRAILKATDLCASEPARAAQRLVDGGFTERYDYALQTLNEVPYNNWRDYDAEDTMRFYALRLHEAGLIKSSPHKIIADGTDWRFLNEVKRELKA
jgi:NitT/TauT family transport system substrate-binding protein